MAKVNFIDNSDKFIEELQSKIQTALVACGLQSEGYAKMLCPVDTGRLRNSITHDVRMLKIPSGLIILRSEQDENVMG